MIRYCRRCVMPDTKPDLLIDEQGICSACRNFDARETIDWDGSPRRAARRCSIDTGSADGSATTASIPVSGGKDSTYQVARMLELGRNPLCVTATTDKLSDDRPPQHREPQTARRRLRRGHHQPRRSSAHQSARALTGRRHLVAGARDDLHGACADRGPDGHPPDRLGREPSDTSTADPPRRPPGSRSIGAG